MELAAINFPPFIVLYVVYTQGSLFSAIVYIYTNSCSLVFINVKNFSGCLLTLVVPCTHIVLAVYFKVNINLYEQILIKTYFESGLVKIYQHGLFSNNDNNQITARILVQNPNT